MPSRPPPSQEDQHQTGNRPRLLDLFCGAGGAAMGYHKAGWDVVGVDIAPQPNYPFEFCQQNALNVNMAYHVSTWGFDAIHASPPCQAYTHARHIANRGRADHPRLIEATRELLQAVGLPYVIENVPGAPLVDPILLCGSMFGLGVRRHRLFETNWPILAPTCTHAYEGEPRYPSTPRADGSRPMSAIVNPLASGVSHELMAEAMGIDWMTKAGERPSRELHEAIPPAYTEFIGADLLRQLQPLAVRGGGV